MARPDVDIAIVGGGAAGLATAIFAAQERPGGRIAIFDGARSLGAKILVSGGGRCNVTNRHVVARDFNGGSARATARVLQALPVRDTIEFFRGLGVALHEEERGKLFPDSNRARTVLDALVGECRARQVSLRAGTRIQEVSPGPAGFRLTTAADAVTARRVVLATGGLSLPKTGSDGHGYTLARTLGHSLVPTTPALVPLLLEGQLHQGLAGLSHEVRLSVTGAGARRAVDGPMLWTHVGVSGPAVLDLSRHVLRHRLEGRSPVVLANFLGTDFAAAERLLLEATVARPRATVATVVAEHVPARLAERLVALAGGRVPVLAQCTREERRAVARCLVELVLPVGESRGYNHAEVTAGGVALDEVDPSTMASRRCAGLFLVGEILDVDGRLGGFNFQWAWASARVAGRGLARSLA